MLFHRRDEICLILQLETTYLNLQQNFITFDVLFILYGFQTNKENDATGSLALGYNTIQITNAHLIITPFFSINIFLSLAVGKHKFGNQYFYLCLNFKIRRIMILQFTFLMN